MMVTVPQLEDDAVRLRPFTLDDVPAVTAACRDPEIPRWTTVPTEYTEEMAREWIGQVATPTDDRVSLAVEDRETGGLAGAISIWIVKQSVGEFGYWTVAEFRGRGLMTGALRLLAGWALDELHLARLQLGTIPGNVASERVAEKVGFRREGLLRSYLDQRGERRDVYLWSLLPGELIGAASAPAGAPPRP